MLPRAFEAAIPSETAADCAHCPMQRGAAEEEREGFFFTDKTRCCTHYPNIPNYLVGALLSSKGRPCAEGRRRVEEIIKAGVGVTPQGIRRPGRYELLLKNSVPDAFGRSEALVCPLLDTEAGKCTIWPYLEAACNTWFCKHAAGLDGRLFWLAVREYLEGLQTVIVQHVLLEMGWDPRAIVLKQAPRGLAAEDLDSRRPAGYERLWDNWAGCEAAFYVHAHTIASGLARADITRLGGVEMRLLLEA
ncbi:MAG TPA: hypothetical protein ENN80_14290, partial [Candidatus Hydrogenedentes bacterium]|nr:hypothetical protein [Candidatus Hydrogenedentota bacterium]